MFFKNFAKGLVTNMPPKNIDGYESGSGSVAGSGSGSKSRPQHIDVVLDGGAFNGSYLVGAMYFLKELERQRVVKIDRVSGCSVGAVVALLYLIDRLDFFDNLYELMRDIFTKTHTLDIVRTFPDIIRPIIPKNCDVVLHKKLYISYHNVKKNKKVVKNTYSSPNVLIETLIKTGFIPTMSHSGEILYKAKYMDGILPHIFKSKSSRDPLKKILYLDLFGYDKVAKFMDIRNEITNCSRVVVGMLDIHTFFIKNSPTSICSYIDDWSIIHSCRNRLKHIIERILVIVVQLMVAILYRMPDMKWINKFVVCKIFKKWMTDVYVIALTEYCL